ncbi:MAG: hypothetical protein LUG52_00660 [Clostridia bacterium]|nr:hypothetical protein [Clostridia bacterium]
MKIKIAGVVFDVKHIYPYAERAAKDYFTDEIADFAIEITKEQIARAGEKSKDFSPAYNEWLEIHRQICRYFEERDGIMMHGAVISYNGAAYMFTAPSGTGKTTHVMQWKKLCGDRVEIINGDKPIIRFMDGEYFVYGTPWCGKERFNINTRMKLCGIALLSRAEENRIERVDPAEYLNRLISQIYFHKTPECVSNTLDFADKMLKSVPVYSLQCNIGVEAAEVARRAMTEHSN